MLPKSVAERLKKGEQVDAEMYSDATVFFSDIVGFTAISAQSSPLQIVEMLNGLYSKFDNIIKGYEIYKVETIGDAYMVVSGVPRRIGRRHASEMAAMALELLNNIKKEEIPHLPETKFRLRIGIHSGSVLAGVVGTKMPRYCLFGETVTIAAMMESQGKSNKIQISHTTRDLLEDIGGFVISERGDNVLRENRELFAAFPAYVRTYWLLRRDDVIPDGNSVSSESILQDGDVTNSNSKF